MAQSLQSTWGRLPAEPILIDVRTEYEFVGYHLPHAIHIPYDELERFIPGLLQADKPIWVYSTNGLRSRVAALKLRNAGIPEVEAFTIDQLQTLFFANTHWSY